jgi:hypothetical protein
MSERNKNTVVSGGADAPAVDETQEGTGPGVAPLESGAIGSTTVKNKPRPKVERAVVEEEEDTTPKVAVYSNGNIHWDEVGIIATGYNLVTEEAAAKWVTLGGVRLATPEEVAKEFAK